MADFTENVRKAYELYLLGEKREAFSLLIPGTKHHYYLSIIEAMKTERHMLSKETLDMITNFEILFNDQEVVRVKLQKLFLQYDGAKNDAERERIITELTTGYIGHFYDHDKPADMKRKKDLKQEDSKVKTMEFDQDKHFNEEKYIKSVENDTSGALRYCPETLYNKLDFNKISEIEFYQFLDIPSSFASLTSESFWNKLVDTLNQKFKRYVHFVFSAHYYDKFTLEQLQKLDDSVPNLKNDPHFIGKIFEK